MKAIVACIIVVKQTPPVEWCTPLDLDEFLVPKEISLLRKATFSSRLGEGTIYKKKCAETHAGETFVRVLTYASSLVFFFFPA